MRLKKELDLNEFIFGVEGVCDVVSEDEEGDIFDVEYANRFEFNYRLSRSSMSSLSSKNSNRSPFNIKMTKKGLIEFFN
jgi:hypothetical protein